jgi:hypothetical protein
MIGKAINELLTNAASVTAIIGTKFFPVNAPQQESNPFLVYGVTDTMNTNTKEETIMDAVQVQIHCYAKTYIIAQEISHQVRLALEKKKGVFAGIGISDIEFDNFKDAYDNKNERFVGELTFKFYVNGNYQI